MYLKQFEIRWSDLDANRHVANSTYSALLVEARMSYLRSKGFSQKEFAEYAIGPVVFSEEFFYLKEIMPSEMIQVGTELLANSADFKFAKFAHYLFNENKKLSLYSTAFFGWFDLKARKLIVPPKIIIQALTSLGKAENYELLPENMPLKNPRVPYGKTLD